MGLRSASVLRTKLRNFVVRVCKSRIPDIRNCYEGEYGRRKKNSPSRTKYISVSDHKLPFPVPARRWPTIFPRHLSWFIPGKKGEGGEEKKKVESRTSRKKGERRRRMKEEALFLVSHEELIDLVRR